MKIIGIHIDKTKAICCVLEKDGYGEAKILNAVCKNFILKDDTDNTNVRNLQSSLFSYFDSIQPERIVILARQTKGRFRSAPLSFKIEGLIQCYEEVDVEFISGPKMTAFYRKNEFALTPEFDYQENAVRAALYLSAQE